MSQSNANVIIGYWRRVVMNKITNQYESVGFDSVVYAERIVRGVECAQIA
jgi:hypothetical protein